jgi:hypothetical protein
MKRSPTIRVAITVAVLIGLAAFVRFAGVNFMATLRRMHGHP